MILDAAVHDREIAGLVGDAAHAGAMAEVEAALARAEAALGIIPAEAGPAISAAALSMTADAEVLADSVKRSGTPVLGLVAELRRAVGPPHDAHVHWGVTSQDIVDSAGVLTARAALAALEARLETVLGQLAALARDHRDTPMAGRTRFQQAVPVSFGLRVAGWAMPLLRALERLEALRARLFVVQLGGAAGTLSALRGQGGAVAEKLAEELELAVPPMPWHAQRDSLAELGAWLALVAGALGKIGGDTVLLSQSEVGELAEGGEGHGGSSTMPQKANPVLGEALIAGGRLAAGQLPALFGALNHAGERDGAAWQTEWVALPELFSLAGASLANAESLLGNLTVNAARMSANLVASGGLVLAEAAAFALAETMPLADAQKLVAAAAKRAVQSGRNLAEELAEAAPEADLSGLGDMAAQTGEAGIMVDAVLAEIAARLGSEVAAVQGGER